MSNGVSGYFGLILGAAIGGLLDGGTCEDDVRMMVEHALKTRRAVVERPGLASDSVRAVMSLSEEVLRA